MNAYVVTTAIATLAALGLAVFVYLNNHKSALSRRASFVCASVGWFCLFLTFLYLTDNRHLANLYAKALNVGAFFIPSTFLHFALVFSGRAESKKTLIRIAYLVSFVFLCFIATPLIIKSASMKLGSLYYPDAGSAYPVFLVTFTSLWLYAEYTLFEGFKSCQDPTIKNQYKYILVAMAIGLISALSYVPLVMGITISPFAGYTIIFALALIVYSIAKHRLMDINVVIKKTLIYSVLIALITMIYLVGVLLIEKYFQSVFGYESIIITIVIVSLIAVFFIPARNSVQTFLDRYFFKGTLDSLSQEKERLEEEVRRSEKLKAVGTLAAGMAHEIKNPLTSIKTFAEFLPKKHNDPEFINKFQNIVVPEVDKINNIVRQLLDFAKPSPLSIKEVHIEELLEEILVLLNNSFIKYHVDVHKKFPVLPMIKADSTQLKQVFLNLILNAIDAMKEKGGKLTIGLTKLGNNLEISIEDTGCGINKKDLAHLFDPFYTTKGTGSGLGLSIVHGIVEKHRGRITVQSNPGVGTKFIIYLPLYSI